jgi:sugar lactone lactonase YvrE
MTAAPGEDAIDGIKVEVEGNLFVSGSGGLWILSPGGHHLGTVLAPRHPHNMARDGYALSSGYLSILPDWHFTTTLFINITCNEWH